MNKRSISRWYSTTVTFLVSVILIEAICIPAVELLTWSNFLQLSEVFQFWLHLSCCICNLTCRPLWKLSQILVFNVFVKGKHLERGARTWRVIRCTFCLLLLGFLLFPVATLTTQCFNITLTRAIWEWSKPVMSTGKKPPVLFLCSVNAIQFLIKNSTIAAATLILLAAAFAQKLASVWYQHIRTRFFAQLTEVLHQYLCSKQLP